METVTRKAYPSDLTDGQWAILGPLVPASKHGGRPRMVNMREVINTILYLDRTGCQWDMLPHDLLPKSTAKSPECVGQATMSGRLSPANVQPSSRYSKSPL